MRIGYVPGSFKPYHKGHHGLVLQASRECDQVIIYASDADREGVTGDTMAAIWTDFITELLPRNVTVRMVRNPIRSVYEDLGEANESGSRDTYTVYAGESDIKNNFPEKNRKKYFGKLYSNKQVKFEKGDPSRPGADIRATMVRKALADGDRDAFIEMMPEGIDVNGVWDTLGADDPESKLREYIRRLGMVRQTHPTNRDSKEIPMRLKVKFPS